MKIIINVEAIRNNLIASTWHELETNGKSAFPFSNSSEGFQSAKEWAVKLIASNNTNQIVMGLELTGHYWFCLATWMVTNGIRVVQVNLYAVKQTKEVEDNSQRKDDMKALKLSANLVKDGASAGKRL